MAVFINSSGLWDGPDVTVEEIGGAGWGFVWCLGPLLSDLRLGPSRGRRRGLSSPRHLIMRHISKKESNHGSICSERYSRGPHRNVVVTERVGLDALGEVAWPHVPAAPTAYSVRCAPAPQYSHLAYPANRSLPQQGRSNHRNDDDNGADHQPVSSP